MTLTRDQIDVADLSAHTKGLREKTSYPRLASDFLVPRETYILVDMKPTDVKNYFIVTPMLHNSDILTLAYMNKLQPKPPKLSKTLSTVSSNPSSRSNSRSSLGAVQLSKAVQNNLNELQLQAATALSPDTKTPTAPTTNTTTNTTATTTSKAASKAHANKR